ncbi:MAG: sulfotransferase domain-containing protein [Gemmatimonadota bacterium]|nr:sulfotransferase domain-containing protein [Gemmatimonadota bacterium]
MTRERTGEPAFRRLKRSLGYYDARRRLLREPFRRALRSTDAFLVGHPKSGNTWLGYMLAVLLFRDEQSQVTLANVGDYVPFVHGRDDRIRRYGHLPDPRVFRNEDPQYPGLYPRTIYLVRDPRAALVSLWRMYQTMFDRSDLAFADFLDDYARGDGIFSWWNSKLVRWDRQVAEGLERAGSDSAFRLVRYEDMVEDRERSVRELAAFLEAGASEGDVERAVARGGFSAMQADEERHGAEAYAGRARGEGRFVRRGRVAGWREEIDDASAARIVDLMGDVMGRAGYRP